jgi:hypothetical protein
MSSLIKVLAWVFEIALPSVYKAQKKFASKFLRVWNVCAKCEHIFVKETPFKQERQQNCRHQEFDHENWVADDRKIWECPTPNCCGTRYQGFTKGDCKAGESFEDRLSLAGTKQKTKARKLFHYFSPIQQLSARLWWDNFDTQIEPFIDPVHKYVVYGMCLVCLVCV